ncbi:MAG TPA: hypothetical protein VG126_11780 [Thermoleophilaceae bacterium]|nr:hypothetical protein [Thermoleophilaceae bacterium]
MRIRLAVVLALALLTAVPAEAARDVFVRDSPRSAVATCLRPTGAPGMVGMIGPLRSRMSPYDLLRVSASGVTVAGTARLGLLDECPAVAASASGHAVVAGTGRTERGRSLIRAALAEPGAGFGEAVDIARARSYPSRVVAAISPRGDAVVVWMLLRATRRGGETHVHTRVVAALRPAGGEFGRPRFLTRWRRASFFSFATVSAGMDASGTATVAWAQAIPDRDISSLHRVEVAAARPGEPFGPPQVLAATVQDTRRVALAVGQDGRALLVHDGGDTIQLFERGPGASEFARVRPWRRRSGRTGWELPEVALASDGSAVVGWRGNEAAGNEDVFLSSRGGTGPWTAPVRVQRTREGPGTGREISFVVFGGGRQSPPSDAENAALRVAMGADGRYLASWPRERETMLGDRLLEARIVHGQAGERPSRPEPAGCPCRPVEGSVPLEMPGGTPALTYTDNATRMLTFGFELPTGFGRLHVATPGDPEAGAPPPRVTLRRPQAARLGYEQRLRVRVGCDGPCDLRAYVVGGERRARGLGTATLRRAGSTLVAIRPQFQQHLAPPRGGRARVVVHGWAPNGRHSARRSVAVELTRKRLRPLPRLLNVRAMRQGRTVLVTWETDRPAQGFHFDATGQLSRRGERPLLIRTVSGDERRRYRVRLRGDVASVELSVIRDGPPFDRRRRVIEVSG